MIKLWNQTKEVFNIVGDDRKRFAKLLTEWKRDNVYSMKYENKNYIKKNFEILHKHLKHKINVSDSNNKDLRLFDTVIVEYDSDHSYRQGDKVKAFGWVTIYDGRIVISFMDDLCHGNYIVCKKKMKNVLRARKEDAEDLKKILGV